MRRLLTVSAFLLEPARQILCSLELGADSGGGSPGRVREAPAADR